MIYYTALVESRPVRTIQSKDVQKNIQRMKAGNLNLKQTLSLKIIETMLHPSVLVVKKSSLATLILMDGMSV